MKKHIPSTLITITTLIFSGCGSTNFQTYSSSKYTFVYPKSYSIEEPTESLPALIVRGEKGRIEIFKNADFPDPVSKTLGERSHEYSSSGIEEFESQYVPKEKLKVNDYDIWTFYLENDEPTKNELNKIVKSIVSSSPTETQTQDIQEPTQPIAPEITAKDESEKAKETLVSFFNYLSLNEFEKALTLFSLDSQFTPLEELAQGNNKAEVLENYCKATKTCLKATVLEVKQIADYEYNLVVQFSNKDGSLYIFGPCCGATEKEMPSKNKFDFTVKKIDNDFKVTSAPLYRP
jgi:hypothetical protein